jgi:hypothetical protein
LVSGADRCTIVGALQIRQRELEKIELTERLFEPAFFNLP